MAFLYVHNDSKLQLFPLPFGVLQIGNEQFRLPYAYPPRLCNNAQPI